MLDTKLYFFGGCRYVGIVMLHVSTLAIAFGVIKTSKKEPNHAKKLDILLN